MSKSTKRIQIHVRLTQDQRAAIDAAAKEKGVSREAWIRFALCRAMKRRDLDVEFPVTGRPRKDAK